MRVVHHDHLNRPLSRFQLHPPLLSNHGEQRRPWVRCGRVCRTWGIERVLELHSVSAHKPRPVLHDPAKKGSGRRQGEQLGGGKHRGAIQEQTGRSIATKAPGINRVLIFSRRHAVQTGSIPGMHFRPRFPVASVQHQGIKVSSVGLGVNPQSEAILQQRSKHCLELALRGGLGRLCFNCVSGLVPPLRTAPNYFPTEVFNPSP